MHGGLALLCHALECRIVFRRGEGAEGSEDRGDMMARCELAAAPAPFLQGVWRPVVSRGAVPPVVRPCVAARLPDAP